MSEKTKARDIKAPYPVNTIAAQSSICIKKVLSKFSIFYTVIKLYDDS